MNAFSILAVLIKMCVCVWKEEADLQLRRTGGGVLEEGAAVSQSGVSVTLEV